MNKVNLILIVASLLLPLTGWGQGEDASELFPPPVPTTEPIVSAPVDRDKDGSKVDDELEARISAANKMISDKSALDKDRDKARGELTASVLIELIFDRQITKKQIDEFLGASGEIDHLFECVSYGWTGKMALEKVAELPGLMGASLLGVIEAKPIEMHLDEATRNGRVRPNVWISGVTGDSSNTDSRITVAIIDTGVDGSHGDLAGRQAYWKDWTADAHASSQDVGHHGTHVTGIACGTGASAGASPSSISFMDLGSFPFEGLYLSPFHTPASSVTWTSTMYWETGEIRAAQIGHTLFDVDRNLFLISETTSGQGSPLIETNVFANPFPGALNMYSSAPMNILAALNREYAVVNDVSYTGVGDGYNLFSGVAPGCMWAGLKVFQDNGSGSTNDIGEAIDDIVARRTEHRIKVANMSIGVSGSPGIDTVTRNKTNTAASNGIVMVISAGNDGKSAGSAGEVDDPGRAHYAITVAASSDANQITGYSSHGFTFPGDIYIGDEDMKPDLAAPGGSARESFIFSADSNTGDSTSNTGANLPDYVANNYINFQGTSMASPFIAGCAVLVIDALQQDGYVWSYSLNNVLFVKMFLLMTATETNVSREPDSSSNKSHTRPRRKGR